MKKYYRISKEPKFELLYKTNEGVIRELEAELLKVRRDLDKSYFLKRISSIFLKQDRNKLGEERVENYLKEDKLEEEIEKSYIAPYVLWARNLTNEEVISNYEELENNRKIHEMCGFGLSKEEFYKDYSLRKISLEKVISSRKLVKI
jgi:hypothetical protein